MDKELELSFPFPMELVFFSFFKQDKDEEVEDEVDEIWNKTLATNFCVDWHTSYLVFSHPRDTGSDVKFQLFIVIHPFTPKSDQHPKCNFSLSYHPWITC